MPILPVDMLIEVQEAIDALDLELHESKGIHTHRHVKVPHMAHLRKRAAAHTELSLDDIDYWRNDKANLHTAASRQYEKIKGQFKARLLSLVNGFMSGKISEKSFVAVAREAFETAYKAAYRYGLKASGVASLHLNPKDRLHGPAMDPHDADWLKSALAHERRYWNAFVNDVITGDIHTKKFTPAQRVHMYAETLDFVFGSGRVVGFPGHSVIYWIMNPKKEHCVCCEFLVKNNPYTRDTLPGIPRDGKTCMGITKCGCELRVVVPDDLTQWKQIRGEKKRAVLLKELLALKKRKRKKLL